MSDKLKSKPEYNMAEEARFQNILLEEIRSSVQLVAEGVSGLGERMDQRFEQVDKRFDQVDQRLMRVEGKVMTLETQMTRVESGLAQHSKDIKELRIDVNRHDDDIITLKAAVGIKT